MPQSSLEEIYEQIMSERNGHRTVYNHGTYEKHIDVFGKFFNDIVNKITEKLDINESEYIMAQWDDAKGRDGFDLGVDGIQWRHKHLVNRDRQENHPFDLIDYLRIRKVENVGQRWDGTSISLKLLEDGRKKVGIGIIEGTGRLQRPVDADYNHFHIIKKTDDSYSFQISSNKNEKDYKHMVDFIAEKFVEQYNPERIDAEEQPAEESTEKVDKIFVSKNEVQSIVNSLNTKPFIILSGISGTGKTQLARAIAENIVGNNTFTEDEHFQINEQGNYYNISVIDKTGFPDRIAFTPVRPDWTDNKKIWGYLNPLEEKDDKKVFYATDILRLVIEASKKENNEKTYFLILDEMNLARVEYYFSDILSLMESPGETVELHHYKKGDVVDSDSETNLEIPPKISWPKNIKIIGTVNVDETTFSFAPKVLDRAFVLEFLDVNYNIILNNGELLDFCNDLHNILKPVNKHFGYRTVKEMKKYIEITERELNDDIKDFLLKSKVLPKLHGTTIDLGEVLIKLGNYCFNATVEPDLINRDVFDNEPSNESLNKSFSKLKQMNQKLESTGFTSFF